ALSTPVRHHSRLLHRRGRAFGQASRDARAGGLAHRRSERGRRRAQARADARAGAPSRNVPMSHPIGHTSNVPMSHPIAHTKHLDPTSPSPWVVRFVALVRPGGRVLDLACGQGRHSLLLVARANGPLTIVAFEQGWIAGERPVVIQRLAAVGSRYVWPPPLPA